MNHILCPACYAIEGGETKCCSHGCGTIGVVCVRCGVQRQPGKPPEVPYFTCTGTTSHDRGLYSKDPPGSLVKGRLETPIVLDLAGYMAKKR